MSLERRRQMIEPEHSQLSVVRQCELVSISRSGFYYQPAGETPLNLALMRLIDVQFLETPWYGSRQMARHLRHPYIPMRRGFHYLIAIMDWSTRKVLSWRVSNTMDGEFCIEALEEALARFGCPEIFNTDQGSQFTSPRFTGVLEKAGVRISMDGRGRWMDNVFISSGSGAA